VVAEFNCQDFPEGCCGCCVNTRLPRGTLEEILRKNTLNGSRIVGSGGPPRFWDLVKWHFRSGGFWDHLLCFWLVGPTLGLSAWIWARRLGNCCFAGFLDGERRVGCLVHPKRIGARIDFRRYAFPLVPTLRCNRALRCGYLSLQDGEGVDTDGWYEVSRRAAATLRRRIGRKRLRKH